MALSVYRKPSDFSQLQRVKAEATAAAIALPVALGQTFMQVNSVISDEETARIRLDDHLNASEERTRLCIHKRTSPQPTHQYNGPRWWQPQTLARRQLPPIERPKIPGLQTDEEIIVGADDKSKGDLVDRRNDWRIKYRFSSLRVA